MLTNKTAREAKPREARYEIRCDGLPGFLLRVLPSGKKVFLARYRDAVSAGQEPPKSADEKRRRISPTRSAPTRIADALGWSGSATGSMA